MLLHKGKLHTVSLSDVDDKLEMITKGMETINRHIDTMNQRSESLEHLGDLKDRDRRPYKNIHNERH